MEPEMIMCYEMSNQRIALYKYDNELLITNTQTEKAILCLGWQQALDLFDYCVQATKDIATA